MYWPAAPEVEAEAEPEAALQAARAPAVTPLMAAAAAILIKPLREILFIGTLSFFLLFFVFLLILQQSKRHFAESLTIVA